MSHAPKLSYEQWQVVDKTTLLVWIDDTQFFDISPAGNSLELRLNNAVDGSVLYLGDCISVGHAIVRARRHLEGEDE